jgi:DcmR-like sensory protein
MRSHGIRFECLRMRPHDHIGWVFDGPAGFDALAAPFLAEGAARGERLMYVTADPDPAVAARYGSILGPRTFQVASIAEVYGASGLVDATSQRATFASAVALALAEGFTGIRVAADNTPLVADKVRLAAWMRWEITADKFMSENQVTGLCAFDRTRVDVDRLRHLATLHPLCSSDSPVPQYRMFTDDGNLRIEGQIDSFAVSELPRVLDVLPPKTGVLIDLANATLVSRAPLTRLRRLCDTGVTVTIRGEPAVIAELAASGLEASDRLILEAAEPALKIV